MVAVLPGLEVDVAGLAAAADMAGLTAAGSPVFYCYRSGMKEPQYFVIMEVQSCIR